MSVSIEAGVNLEYVSVILGIEGSTVRKGM